MRRPKFGNVMKVARWEFLKSVRTPTFLILTLIIPLIMALVGGVSYLTAQRAESSPVELAVLDYTGDFFAELSEHIAHRDEDSNLAVSQYEGSREQLETDVLAGDYDGFLVIDDESIRSGELTYFVPELREANPQVIRGLLSGAVTSYRLQKIGLDREQIEAATVPVTVRARPIDPDEGIGGIMAPMAVAMILMFSAVFSGQILMYGVLKEKRNRIVEILLSSITSLDLLIGKMVGYGALGLTQIAVWVGAGLILVSRFLALSDFALGAGEIILYCAYFLLGYALLASLFAAMGATMKDAEEGSQGQGLVILIPLIPIFISGPLFMAPDALWAQILSHIPPFIPAAVLLRMAAMQLPAWEIATTMTALILSVMLFVYAAARIFEGGILQFDRNATLREIRKMLAR